jgi:hypothetical protein
MSIARCRISKDGKRVSFWFENGVYYAVDTRYVRAWFPFPEKIQDRGRWRTFQKGHSVDTWWPTDNIRILRSRRVHEPVISTPTRKTWGEVLLYLSNGQAVEVNDDRILAACEPTWELFDSFSCNGRGTRREALAVFEKCGLDPEEPLFIAARSPEAVLDASWNTITRAQICKNGESIEIRLKGGEKFLLPAHLVYGWASPQVRNQGTTCKDKTSTLRVTGCSVRHGRTAVRVAFSNGQARMLFADVLIERADYRSKNRAKAQLFLQGKSGEQRWEPGYLPY